MKSTPTAKQHEAALIGAMLKNPVCREEALSIVSPEHFYSRRSAAIMRAFGVIGDGDYLALMSELERAGFINGEGEEINEYLVSLIQNTATSAGIKHYASKIREAAFRRDMLQAGDDLAKDARNFKLEVGDILEERIAGLNAIGEKEKAISDGRPERKGLDACVIGFDQLVKMEIPERARLFSWLPEGGLSMVYGTRGLGKTFFVTTLAASLTTGTPFMKWGKPIKPTGVLVVDGEMALSSLRERLNSLLVTPPIMPLKVISSEVVFAETERDINFVTQDHRNDIINILDLDKAIRLVIIDNISCLFSGLRESSKDDWEQVTPWLLAMRRRGVAVVLVHHAGKGGDQRGTSGREDMLDTVIRLDRVHGAPSEGARFIVRFTKCRGAYGADLDPFEATLDLQSPELWTWSPVDESTYERLLNLARDGVDSVTDMAEELGVTKGLVSRLKTKGIKSGDLMPGKLIRVVENES